jgi:hypothetical protein
MSVQHTESFYAFGKYAGGDAFDTEGNTARQQTALNLARAEYEVKTSANTDANNSGGFVVRANAVRPTQNALFHSNGVVTPNNLGVSAALKKVIAVNSKDVIIGFNMFVPSDYVANVNSSTVPCFRMAATLASDANWQTAVISPLSSSKELFRVSNDLAVRWGTDSTQSSKKLAAGALNYLEVKIEPGLVSVWIDDTFVMQKAITVVPEAICWIFENNLNAGAGGTSMSGAAGRWGMSDMYVLYDDGVAPTVRLGPTTQLIGSRPDEDISVDFVRPPGYTSNAQVAAQDITDNPPGLLSSTTVGDYDTYASAQNDAAIRAAAMVHAVVVKSLVTNLEPNLHTVRPYAAMGASQAADQKGRELVKINPIPSGRTIRAMAIRPSDGAIWAVGEAGSIWKSGPAADYTTWTRVADAADVSSFTGIAFRADNVGVAVMVPPTGTSRAYMIRPGSDAVNVPGAVTTDYRQFPSTGVVPAAAALSYDNNTFIVSSSYAGVANTTYFARSADPINGAWTQVTLAITTSTGGSGQMAKTANRLVATLTSIAGSVAKTDNNGTSFEALSYSDTAAPYTAITHDGTALIIAYSSNDVALASGPRIRRSTDNGATWSAATPMGTALVGGSQILRAGASNVGSGESLFAGDAGAVVVSDDGINWRQMPRLTTSNLYAAIALPNGDILVGGAAGTLLVYRKQSVDIPLAPLTGYHMALNASVLNPATGSGWTAEQAADSEFGVRLTS